MNQFALQHLIRVGRPAPAQKTHQHPYQLAAGLSLAGVAIPLLWWTSGPNRLAPVQPAEFLLFHTAVELFAVVVAMLICVTGYSSMLSRRKGAVVWLGVAFLGVGLLDALHMMSYAGMPDAITPNTSQKSLFFWLAARLLAAVALLTYALLPTVPKVGKGRKRLAIALMLAMVGALAYRGLYRPDRLPALFTPEEGLTRLATNLEWLAVALNLLTLAVFWRRRVALANECLQALYFSVALSAASELFLMMSGAADKHYASVAGHVYKIAAYLYLLHATFNEALRRPLERLETQHLREQVTLSAAPDAVLWVDGSGKILMANPAVEALTGYTGHELVGQNVDIFLPPHLRERHGESMREFFLAPHDRPMGSMDLKLLCRDGRMLPVDISLGHWDDDETQYAIAYIRDLTERKNFEDSLRHKATHDDLTGLPNRWLFQLHLNQALARANRGNLSVAVLLLDLDHFKTVNDSFGHATGDALLVQAGMRMRGVLRENDTLARLGGDEFGILLTDLADADEAVSVATKLLVSLQAPYQLHAKDVYSGASLGLAFYPDDARDSETLLRYADMAMYQAKQAQRGTYACYSNDMDKRVHDDMLIHTRLKEVIAHGGLVLHYQPQVDVESGAIVGVEALLRWRDPMLGEVAPARFIPVAEATGLILPLSDWVLDAACRQIAAWMRSGCPMRVAINFSAQQFRLPDLTEKVQATLKRTGAEARWLDIEITESVAMTQPERACKQIQSLVALGCTVALDDFGTGYSSLSYLKTLPVSKLKIDKSFMDGIPHDTSDITISRAIIALAHSLGLSLVAEGVETEAQLDFLRQYGCEFYQGWLFAKAMDSRELAQHLRQLTD